MLTQDQVRYVAKLSRLSLKDNEVEMFASQLGNILTHVEMLGEVDTSHVPPTSQVTDLKNVMRDDVLSPFDAPQELLRCTSLPVVQNQIKVPSVMTHS